MAGYKLRQDGEKIVLEIDVSANTVAKAPRSKSHQSVMVASSAGPVKVQAGDFEGTLNLNLYVPLPQEDWDEFAWKADYDKRKARGWDIPADHPIVKAEAARKAALAEPSAGVAKAVGAKVPDGK